ncbi:bleomycin resistance protein [Microbacterium sp.]|uniref:bleomycin resistance protein n=1 Tax=Microbacterium sp. TaxID=51671 RepID=UPI0025FE5BF8|nr:bleomycin resistance protein [Microbacterium sp.]
MSDRAVPNLPSRDFDATSRFYGSWGFVEHYRDPVWLILRRGSIQLEFFPFPDLDPRESSFMCSIRVAEIDQLHAEIVRAGVPIAPAGAPRLSEIAVQRWGQRAAFLIDLDGTQLHLIEDAG